MTTRERLESLLARWLERQRAGGRPTDAEELCRDAPELLEPLRRRIRELETAAPGDGAFDSADAAGWLAALRGRRDGAPDVSEEAPTPLHPGRLLARRYRIRALLGLGGQGEVWRAKDLKLRVDVALKAVRADRNADRQTLERLRREVLAAREVVSPNVCRIFDLIDADGHELVSMEYVEGKTLREHIDTDGPLPLEAARAIAAQLLAGLEAIHAAGLVHRDLKPENVMLTRSGRVVVMDLGLAKSLAGSSGGSISGTPVYMAPEQVRGESLDARADVYAAGLVLAEMVASGGGAAPASRPALLEGLQREPPELPATPWAPVIGRAMARDRAARYPSAAALARALDEMSPAGAREPGRGWFARRVGAGKASRLAMLLVLALGATLPWLRTLSREAPARAAAPAAAVRAYPLSSVAVLPFENLSTDVAHAFFANGLHGEVLAQLSRIDEISLRGRTSVMGYAKTTKPIRQIAEELHVGALVEGTVQVVGERLRVHVHLVDTQTDESVWAEHYDRTLEDAFAIQSEVAQQVAAAVGARLEAGVEAAIARVPTASPEAYHLYLQARDYFYRPGRLARNFAFAQQLYERAVALDPEFALAWAGLSEVHGWTHRSKADTSPERFEAQRKAAETALRLAPELPQAHIAMGLWHHFGRLDGPAALAEYAIAQRSLPNDARLLERIAWVHRSMGTWVEGHATLERATELDPRSPELLADLGYSYRAARRFPEAVAALDRALALAPDYYRAAIDRGYAYVEWKGSLVELRAALDALPPDADLGFFFDVHEIRGELLLMERDAAGLLEHVEATDPETDEDGRSSTGWLFVAWARQHTGDAAAARDAFAAALRATHRTDGEDWRNHADRGWALAGLGRREEALSEAALVRPPDELYREDPARAGTRARNYVSILVAAGEHERALDEMERLVGHPAWSAFPMHLLRLSPDFDPILDHPRFKALLAAHAGS